MSNDKNTIPATCPPCGCDDGSVGHNIKDHTNEEMVYVEVPCPRCKPCGECEGRGRVDRLEHDAATGHDLDNTYLSIPCDNCKGEGRIVEPCGDCGACLKAAAYRHQQDALRLSSELNAERGKSAAASKPQREFKRWFETSYWLDEDGARSAWKAAEAAMVERCAGVALEQRCERGTPWDLACTTIAAKIRELKGE